MKRKPSHQTPATKTDLHIVKRDLEIRLQKEINLLENRVKLMLDQLERNIDEKNRQYRDEFRADIDPILKEVMASREERSVTAHQVANLRDRVDEHEEQIKRLQRA